MYFSFSLVCTSEEQFPFKEEALAWIGQMEESWKAWTESWKARRKASRESKIKRTEQEYRIPEYQEHKPANRPGILLYNSEIIVQLSY